MFYLCVNMYLLLLFRLTVQDKRIDSVATHSSLPPPMLFMCLQDISWLYMEYMNKNDFDEKRLYINYPIVYNCLEQTWEQFYNKNEWFDMDFHYLHWMGNFYGRDLSLYGMLTIYISTDYSVLVQCTFWWHNYVLQIHNNV